MRYLVFGAFIFLMAGACNPSGPVSREELQQYLMDTEHGLRKIDDDDEISIEVICQPKDLILLQDVGAGNKEQWQEAERQLDSLDYFIVKFYAQGKSLERYYASDPQLKTDVVNYLSNEVSSAITLWSGDDSVSPEGATYIGTLGTAADTNIIVVFKSALKHRDGKFRIVFDGSSHGLGYSESVFEITDLKNIPPLKKNW